MSDEVASYTQENRNLREALWLSHGHPTDDRTLDLYCERCRVSFRTAPSDTLIAAVFNAVTDSTAEARRDEAEKIINEIKAHPLYYKSAGTTLRFLIMQIQQRYR